LTSQVTSATSGLAVGLLAFTTVGREGLETSLFMLAFAFQTNGPLLLLGGLLGTGAAIILGILIYRLGYRLNYRLFFRVMGIVLIVFAAGLLSNAIQNMQSQGWISLASDPMWDTSTFINENEFLGSTLHALVGYSEMPTLLQVILYVGYIGTFGSIFLWMSRRSQQKGLHLPPIHNLFLVNSNLICSKTVV
jgi:high-affinity iron transporter